jgi:hypothetical protein
VYGPARRTRSAQKQPLATHLEAHHLANGGAGGRCAQIGLGAAEAGEVFRGEVDAIPREVLGHVLPMLCELEGGADRVGEIDPFGGRRPEDVQDEESDRRRRQLTVAAQCFEGRISPHGLIAAVGFDQSAKGGIGQPQLAHRRDQALQEWMARAARVDAVELALQLIEQGQAVTARLVAQLIGQTGEAVDGQQVSALGAAQ